MFNVLTLNNISEVGTKHLSSDAYSIVSECKNPDGVMLRSFNMHDMEIPESLLAIARAGAGVNNIPIEKCSDKGIVVFNTPGANANAVKELVITSLLISSRKVVDGVNWVQSLNGKTGVDKLVEKGKAEFIGPEICGKKLGVIGLGAIGVLVANTCKSLGMEVLGYDPYISVDGAWSLSRAVHKAASFDVIFAECDYITVHVPLNNDTKGMFNDEVFSKVKKGLRLLNFSRGELCDNEAVKRAVENGNLSCYVTDFPTEDLLGVKNIITIPHLGASTPESEDNCAAMAAIELKNYLEFGDIKNSVNFPDCELAFTGRKRICVLHKNIPNVVGPITTALAKENLNIDNMINKSKGAFAYTMIDVDQQSFNNIEEVLSKLEGVIKVRVL